MVKNLSSMIRDDEWHTYWRTLPIPFHRLVGIKWAFRWRDQTWGNRKGGIRLVLQRDGQTVTKWEPFGVAPHGWRQEEGRASHLDEIVYSAQRWDRIVCEFRVGGGGGHEITVRDMRVDILPGSGWLFYREIVTARALYLQGRALLDLDPLPSGQSKPIVAQLFAAAAKRRRVTRDGAASNRMIMEGRGGEEGEEEGEEEDEEAPQPGEFAVLCRRLVLAWDDQCEDWATKSIVARFARLPDLPFYKVCCFAFGDPQDVRIDNEPYKGENVAWPVEE
mmetsp:Transcript_16770/g.63781  ORF Transcript_16770/g.63781 Transcript_16770/m.63781 type:complete len:277 (-) Transcript_16770:134-964(-)